MLFATVWICTSEPASRQVAATSSRRPAVDAMTAAKAVQSYRKAPPTGEKGLKDISTKKDEQ